MAQSPYQDYWLPQPHFALSDDERRACDDLLAAALAQGPSQPLDYTLDHTLLIPKWRFLCYAAEHHHFALHGSANGEIASFEPRQSKDFNEFGAQKAIYAAADGIWPSYFAIVNRATSPSIINACVYLEQDDGTLGQPHYFFSISQKAINNQPYVHGFVYLLPSETFVRQSPIEFGPWRIHTAQLASTEAVTPLAKIAIAPEDFPFLAQMHTHDDTRLGLYAEAMTNGLPLPE